MELRLLGAVGLLEGKEGAACGSWEPQGALIVPGSVIAYFHPALASAPLSLPEK